VVFHVLGELEELGGGVGEEVDVVEEVGDGGVERKRKKKKRKKEKNKDKKKNKKKKNKETDEKKRRKIG